MPKRSDLHHWLHTMWTRDVGREGYNKTDWIEFEQAIHKLERELEEHQDNNISTIKALQKIIGL